jgi:hypothetical protein
MTGILKLEEEVGDDVAEDLENLPLEDWLVEETYSGGSETETRGCLFCAKGEGNNQP